MATRFVEARDGNFYLEVSALLKSENLWVTSVVNSHGKKNAAIQGFFKQLVLLQCLNYTLDTQLT
jgi:hypothetical protein